MSSIKKGTQVSWNSQGNVIKGKVEKKVTSDTKFMGKNRKASKDEPQYIVKSDQTGATAMHKKKSLKKK